MPRVSVILPAYYSHGTLRECLEGLRAQIFRDFEVIVVNSSQEELSARVAEAFPEVHFIQSPRRLLPHAARNRGVEQAKGELLVFSDPDCVASPDWLVHLVRAWETGHQIVGGSMGLRSQRWFEQGVHLCKFHPLLEGQSASPRWILPTANAAYARDCFDQIGPFNGEVFAGDALLSWRGKTVGIQPWFEPRAVVAHRHEGTLAAFVHQRIRRGKEFGNVRANYEGWSKARLIASMAATPLLIAVVLVRAARDTGMCGWFKTYLRTFPLQLAGHGAWACGEACGYWQALSDPGSSGRHQAPAAPALK